MITETLHDCIHLYGREAADPFLSLLPTSPSPSTRMQPIYDLPEKENQISFIETFWAQIQMMHRIL